MRETKEKLPSNETIKESFEETIIVTDESEVVKHVVIDTKEPHKVKRTQETLEALAGNMARNLRVETKKKLSSN